MRHRVPPTSERSSGSWRAFLGHYKDQILACDFFTVETYWLKTIYVLFFINTPLHAPRANSFAERRVRSDREECLAQILILNENHLQRVLKEYDQYYNDARPHQGIGRRFPVTIPGREQNRNGPIRRRNILGGIIHEEQRQPSSQVYTNGLGFLHFTGWILILLLTFIISIIIIINYLGYP